MPLAPPAFFHTPSGSGYSGDTGSAA